MPDPWVNALPPDTRTAGSGNPPLDMDGVSDALAALGAGLNVLNPVFGAADPAGVIDSTAAINAALTAAGAAGTATVVSLPPGTYKTTAPLNVPSFVTLRSDTRGYGTPIDNYGISGLVTAGAIIKPASSFSGTGVIVMNNNAGVTQMGGQQFIGITIDGSSLTGGNSVHGIESIGRVAAVTIRDCTIYKVGGNGIYGNLSSTFQPADFWDVSGTRCSNCGGWGFQAPGLSDSVFLNCQMSTNNSGGYLIHDQSNVRFTACEAEQTGAGPGWQIEFVSASGGVVTLIGCHSEFDHLSGFYCTGSAASTIILDGCSSTGDGNGSVSAGYAGLLVSACASQVIAHNFTTLSNSGFPQYGVSQVSASYGTSVTSSQLQAATAPTHDDGSNTSALAYFNLSSASAAFTGMARVATTGTSGYTMTAGTGTILTWTAPSDSKMHAVRILALMHVSTATTGGACTMAFTTPAGNTKTTSWFSATKTADDYSADFPQWLECLVGSGGIVTLSQSSGVSAGAAVVYAEFWSN